jgi:rod shape determining protein RodA
MAVEQVVRKSRRHVDWPVIAVTAALMVLGLATLYAAASSAVQDGLPRPVVMQAGFMGIGAVAMLALAFVDSRVFERGAYVAYAAVVVMLVLVLIIGPVRGGSQRWLPLGPFNLQPSELAKLALVLACARYFASNLRDDGWGIRQLVTPALLFLVPLCSLTFFEPDLGTTLFLIFIFAGVTFVVGLRWRTLVALALVAALSAPLAYRYVLDDYQRERVDILFAPDADPKGKGYQAIQGRWAIGAGRLTGVGWNKGTQGRLRFLPEQHTDFIFSVYAEERGFLGCVVALGLYFSLLMLGLLVAWNARDRFGSILAAGVVTILLCQIGINLGGVLGLLPITGVTLPFMSYGGSSVITILLGIGMLLSVSMRRGAH